MGLFQNERIALILIFVTFIFVTNEAMGAALTVPPALPTSQTVDQGQGIYVSINSPSGGTPPYHYQWQAIIPGSSTFTNTTLCSAPTTQVCSFTTTTSTTIGNYQFRVRVQDNRVFPSPRVTYSTAANVTVNTQLSLDSPTASNTVMDQGQRSRINVNNAYTGTPSYTYQWFVLNPGQATYSSISGATATTYNLITTGTTTTGEYRFVLQVKDSATVNSVTNSPYISVILNPALSVPAPTAVPSNIYQGENSLISILQPTTGTSPYFYQWFRLDPGSGTYSQITGETSNTYLFTTNSLTTPGTYGLGYVLRIARQHQI